MAASRLKRPKTVPRVLAIVVDKRGEVGQYPRTQIQGVWPIVDSALPGGIGNAKIIVDYACGIGCGYQCALCQCQHHTNFGFRKSEWRWTLFTWTYTIAVDSNETLSPSVNSGCNPATPCPAGSFFTLYDIVGLSSPSAPTNWGSTVQFVGITPSFVVAGDLATVENLTFFYTGPAAPGPLTQDGFSFQSTSNEVGQIQYAFSATSNGTGDSGRGFVDGPTGTVVTAPEPSSVALMLVGVGLVFVMRKRTGQRLPKAS